MTTARPVPLYQQVKDYISSHVASGEWVEGDRVPSENELVRRLGASRMTVNRALRELSVEGVIRRVQGLGTFVESNKAQSTFLEIRNIADEIRERGHSYHAEPYTVGTETVTDRIAYLLELEPGARVFHSIIVHFENREPVQLEDRFVNPAIAPDYLDIDFTETTPNEYLMRVAPLLAVEHVVEATPPNPLTQKLLSMSREEPCLLLHRRTWSGRHVAAYARLLHPGSRYRLSAQFPVGD
ncbi:MAG: histidine utilization repressor [Alphaproteobacteria bacterium]|nr:histidine utilization repressor [Alphaproteobacteria bacterium]